MKKKGLIISTIVMMLVVVVALSTATYAWFAVSADAKISTLTVQTAASDGLQIAAVYPDRLDSNVIKGKSGEMNLSTDSYREWIGGTNAYGAELIFETALASAYGVTGNGLAHNMYTAASRSATAFATTSITIAWWDTETDGGNSTQGADYIANYGQFYSNSTGMTLATTTGAAIFTQGAWSGQTEEGEVGGVQRGPRANIADKGYYIRTQGYDTIKIDASNAEAYLAVSTTVYYSEGAGQLPATGEGFTDGKYTGIVASALIDLFVRKVHTLPANEVGVSGITYYTDFALTQGAVDSENLVVDTVYYYIGKPQDVEIAWDYDANNSALTTGDIPRYMIPARANSEYFSLNFALRTQRGMVGNPQRQNIADIFLKKLSVTASGGMAAAARIAIYEYEDNSYTYDAGTTDLKYVYAPFAKSNYVSEWERAASPETLAFDVAPVKTNVETAQHWDGVGFAYNKVTGSSFSERVISDNTLIHDTASSTWQTATFFDIDKNVVWNDLNLYTTAQGFLGGGTEADANYFRKINSIGAFTAANITKYYQLVIWFEGTDAQCISTYAGTGVTVDIAFDFFQRFKDVVDYEGFPVVNSTTGRVVNP